MENKQENKQNATCCTCLKPKATLTCGICKEPVCKYCAQFLDDSSFAFLPNKSLELQQTTFCVACFDLKIAPVQLHYEQTLERAKNIQVFDKTQGKETRLIKRKADQVDVKDCADYEETLLRLAFLAALGDYNAIIDVDIAGKKIQNGTYKHTIWSGTAMPAQVNEKKLLKDRALWQNPN